MISLVALPCEAKIKGGESRALFLSVYLTLRFWVIHHASPHTAGSLMLSILEYIRWEVTDSDFVQWTVQWTVQNGPLRATGKADAYKRERGRTNHKFLRKWTRPNELLNCPGGYGCFFLSVHLNFLVSFIFPHAVRVCLVKWGEEIPTKNSSPPWKILHLVGNVFEIEGRVIIDKD